MARAVCCWTLLAACASMPPPGRVGAETAGSAETSETQMQTSTVSVSKPARAKRVGEITSKPPPDGGRPDPLAAVPNGPAVTPELNIDGIPFTKVFPPDTIGEVGTTHFVQMVNRKRGSEVGIFTKTGTLVRRFRLGDLALRQSPCFFGRGDPVPIFDQFAGRWLLTEFRNPSRGGPGVCIYVSSGANPATSTFLLYQIDTPKFPDYPKWGVWPDAYYMGANDLSRKADAPAVYAIDRAAILAGDPTRVVRRELPELRGFTFNPIAPADLDGASTPPDGAPGIFIRHRDDESHDPSPAESTDALELFELAPNFDAPESSTLAMTKVGITEFNSELCGLVSFDCVSQPQTRLRLDPLREPVMNRPLLRTFLTHQSLVGSFVTDIDTNDTAGVRWFELRRPAGAESGGWSLFQEGTVGGDGVHRWLPSIAMNGVGDIALGYSASSKSVFPSIRVSGRRAGDDPGALTLGESTLAPGGHAQKLITRWGDYSAMSVDPTDDRTFWYTNEIAGPQSQWLTKISAFSFGP